MTPDRQSHAPQYGTALLQFLFLIALCGFGPARAAYVDWVRIDSNDEFTTYVDYGNINRSGDLARIWDMRDYKKPHTSHSGQAFSSQKSLIEADCKGERFRLVGMTMYSGRDRKSTRLNSSHT